MAICSPTNTEEVESLKFQRLKNDPKMNFKLSLHLICVDGCEDIHVAHDYQKTRRDCFCCWPIHLEFGIDFNVHFGHQQR